MATTFDPKCWDLACHFLADVPHATDAFVDAVLDAAKLARRMQGVA